MTGGQVSRREHDRRTAFQRSAAAWIRYRKNRKAKIRQVRLRNEYKEMKTVFNLVGIEVM